MAAIESALSNVFGGRPPSEAFGKRPRECSTVVSLRRVWINLDDRQLQLTSHGYDSLGRQSLGGLRTRNPPHTFKSLRTPNIADYFAALFAGRKCFIARGLVSQGSYPRPSRRGSRRPQDCAVAAR